MFTPVRTPASRIIGNVQCIASRCVSSKYPRPTPRPFRRRWFEAAVAPVLPEKLTVCAPRISRVGEEQPYDDVELALSRLVKKWMASEEFRVMAVCQFLPVAGRTLWLTKNQLRLKGLEFRSYGNRIMRKVFEVECNGFLFGKDISALKTITEETEKINWLYPLGESLQCKSSRTHIMVNSECLVCMVDSRIIAMDEVRWFTKVASLEDHRAETVQILSSQLGALPQTLGSPAQQLTYGLDQISSRSS
ncbi:unnamed protein product [Nippostrongylus brasiliensis]|uniref:Large ribosomal subunit protein uL10m n=1 Tax=Nippostrongylus brasiliensis TaxID=27835 RepID=A0A0N4Y5P7_NIPBR|nr:unnamed protein product [Nippostrongylus brasiliensis]